MMIYNYTCTRENLKFLEMPQTVLWTIETFQLVKQFNTAYNYLVSLLLGKLHLYMQHLSELQQPCLARDAPCHLVTEVWPLCTLYQKKSDSRNWACYDWSRCNGKCLVFGASASATTGSVFMQRSRLLFGECVLQHSNNLSLILQ